jgi:hypothetical protein
VFTVCRRYASKAVSIGATFDEIAEQNQSMELSEFIRVCKDYGVLHVLSLQELRQKFTAANIGPAADSRRSLLNESEFIALMASIAEVLAPEAHRCAELQELNRVLKPQLPVQAVAAALSARRQTLSAQEEAQRAEAFREAAAARAAACRVNKEPEERTSRAAAKAAAAAEAAAEEAAAEEAGKAAREAASHKRVVAARRRAAARVSDKKKVDAVAAAEAAKRKREAARRRGEEDSAAEKELQMRRASLQAGHEAAEAMNKQPKSSHDDEIAAAEARAQLAAEHAEQQMQLAVGKTTAVVWVSDSTDEDDRYESSDGSCDDSEFRGRSRGGGSSSRDICGDSTSPGTYHGLAAQIHVEADRAEVRDCLVEEEVEGANTATSPPISNDDDDAVLAFRKASDHKKKALAAKAAACEAMKKCAE